ncbi:hypothetical protein BC833DRAFT_599584 [Globomyces pollinis-pini]|nr:hypothetical protein BC833DRAFT_599584 [Globomyces pollinis-pini]
MSDSFLFKLCDFHISYLGCTNKEQYLIKDYVMLGLSILTHVTYGLMVLQKLYLNLKDGKLKIKNWKDMDSVCLFSSMHGLVRMIFYINVISVFHIDISNWTNTDIIQYVQKSIYLELISLVFGSIAGSFAMVSFVTLSTKMKLFEPIIIKGKKFDVAKLIRIIRAVTVLSYIVLATLWAFKGTNSDISQYLYFRRLFYTALTFSCWFISAPVVYFSLYRLIQNIRNANTKPSCETKHESQLEGTKQAVNDIISRQLWHLRYLMNYGTFYFYICLGFYFMGLLTGVYLEKSQSIQFAISIIGDAYFWIVIYSMSCYLGLYGSRK